MKTFVCITAILLLIFIIDLSEIHAQMPGDEDYTVINGTVCVGTWVPSKDVALPGSCEGQLVEMHEFAALAAKQSADRLYQVLKALTSIDQKLSVNNDQIKQLIQATNNPQFWNERLRQGNFLRERITKRFDELPKEMLSNGLHKEQITELKENLLKEIEKLYPTHTAPPTK
jgi:hypothetical protein